MCIRDRGPIIHNPQVVGRLEDKGVSPVQEVSDIEEGTMIIRSHGCLLYTSRCV